MLQVFFLSIFSIFAGVPVFPRYSYGIGTTDEINDEQIECLLNQNYKFVYLRVFNDGKGDKIGMKNVLKVRKTKLGYLVYVTPDPNSSAKQQVEDLINFGFMYHAEFIVLFLEITDPLRWKKNKQKNVDFINKFFVASEFRGMRLGFYTSWYDYKSTGTCLELDQTPKQPATSMISDLLGPSNLHQDSNNMELRKRFVV